MDLSKYDEKHVCVSDIYGGTQPSGNSDNKAQLLATVKNVKALVPVEIFKANCEAGNEKELLIKDLVESYDLKINGAGTPGTIAAISTLEKIYDRNSYDVLNRVLNLIVMTWEGENKSFSSNILNGVTRLVMCFGDALKDEVFVEKVGGMSIRELSKIAKERRAGALGYAEAMLIAYNKRNKAGLTWQRLYSGSSNKTTPLDENGEPKRKRKQCG